MATDYIEWTISGGATILIDKADYNGIPKNSVWRLSNSHGRSVPVAYLEDPKKPGRKSRSATSLWKLLFAYDHNSRMVGFRNGNPLDLRRENVFFPERDFSNRVKKAMARRAVRSKNGKLFINGCVLTKAPEGNRCAGAESNCEHYMTCLDWVSHKTDWEGWKAQPA
ncbi:MAG: hypothetical protein LLG06_01790 [Desulfobacteraceae bacterium]|nr:hypothetical protein [Desulfobacteraceae bacterium]